MGTQRDGVSRGWSARVAGILLGASLLPSGAGAAEVVLKTSDGNGADLVVGANWNGAAVPGVGDVAVFTNTAGRTYNLSANTSWGGIAKRTTAFATTITNVNATLTLGAGGVDLSQAAGNLTVTTLGLVLGAAQTWAVTNGTTLTVNSILSGDAGTGLIQAGGGTLTLAGANTFGGGLTLNSGTLNINNAAALGTGTLTINGGTLADATLAGTTTLSGNNAQNWNGNFSVVLSGGRILNLGTGAVTLGAPVQVDINTNTLTVGGSIAGAAGNGLVKSGVGQLTLSGSNTFSGGLTIKSGTVLANTSASALGGSGSGSVILGDTAGTANATLSLAAFTWSNALTVAAGNSGTNTVLVNGNSVVTYGGAITLNNSVTLDTGSGSGSLNITGSIGGNAGLIKNGVSTGALSLGGNNTFSGGVTLNGGSITLNNVAALGSGLLTINGGTLNDSIAGSATLANNIAQRWNGSFGLVLGGARNLNLGTGAVTLGTNIQVSVNMNNLTVGGAIGDGGFGYGLTKTGAGTLQLSGANTYSGGTTNNAGLLQATTPGSLPGYNLAGQVVVAGGATLAVNAGGAGQWAAGDIQNALANVNFNPGAVFGLDTTGGSFSYGSAITNAGTGLIKLGGNTLTLTGANTYSGGTTVGSGVLALASTDALPGWANNGSYAVNNGAALAVGHAVSDDSIAAILATANFAAGASLGFDTTVGDRSYGVVLSDTANGALGLFKIGSNTLTLTASNLYSGVTTIGAGTLQLGDGTTDGSINSSSGITNNGTLIFNVVGSQSYTNRISGTGALTKLGAGALFLTTNNTYSGGTTLSAGTLQLGGVGNLGSVNGALTNNGGVLDLNGLSLGVGNFTGTGGLVTNSGTSAVTLTIGNNNGSGSFQGVIGDNAAGGGTLGVKKAGTGTIDLSGANTYSGGTTNSAGTLALGGDNVLGSGALTLSGGALASDGAGARALSNAVAITANATFGNTVNTGALTLSGPLDLTAATRNLTLQSAVTLAGAVTNGAFNKLGTGTLILKGSGDLGVAGNVTEVQSGTLIVDGAALGSISGFRPDVAVSGDTARLVLTNGASLVLGGSSSLRVGFDGSAAGTNIFDIAASATATNSGTAGLILRKNGSVNIANLLAGGVLTVNNITTDAAASNNTSFNFDGGTLRAASNITTFLSGVGAVTVRGGGAAIDSAGYNITVAQALLDGGGGLTKLGGGTLTLTGSNTYSGGTTVSAGTLQINTGGTLGTGNVTNQAKLIFNRTDVFTVSNKLAGAGGVTKQAAGTVILTGSNTYSGGTTISGGTLQLDGDGTLGAGNVTNNATLAFNRSDGATVGNKLLGTGAVTKSGPGSLTLSGANTYTGGTVLSNGVLVLGSSGALGSSGTLTFGGGTLQFSAANITDYSARFSTAANQTFNFDTAGQNVTQATALASSGGTLTKLGGGTLALTAANSYTGGTVVNAGTLALFGSGSLGSGPVDISRLANLDASKLGGGFALASGQSLTNRGTFTGGLIINPGASVSGGGSFAGAVTNLSSSLLTPGLGGDTNFFQSLTLAGGSTNAFWVGSATFHDLSIISNSLAYTGLGMPQLKVDLSSYTWNSGDNLVLYDNLFSGPSVFDGTNRWFTLTDAFGAATNLYNGTLFSAVTDSGSATNLFRVSYEFNNGDGTANDIVLTAVPEPASLQLLMLVGAVYGLRRRWVRKTARAHARPHSG